MAKKKVGIFLGTPYDWRRPTKVRLRSRVWNPKAPLFNPRWYGWGWDVNFYALLHPQKWRKARER